MLRMKEIYSEVQKQMFSPKITLHIVMWSLVFMVNFLTHIFISKLKIIASFEFALFIDILLAILYYLNANYLVPNFLAKDKLLLYFGQLLLIICGVSLLDSLCNAYGDSNFKFFAPKHEVDVITIFYSFCVCAFFFTIIKIVSDWLVQTRHKSELETRAFQSELNLLKSQINPHFLFNTLNSLYALTLKKSDVAPEIVLRLSEMMRYMLYECNIPLVPVSKEVDYIKNYLYLEKIRHAKIDVNFDVDCDDENLEVAPLIFMAFIENAFKHGAGNHIHAGHINIELKTKNEQLFLTVENSRAEQTPMSNNLLIKSGGVGMVNVKRRLQLLYPTKYSLKIDETPHTYTVQLWLNLSNTTVKNLFEAEVLSAPSVQKMKILR